MLSNPLVSPHAMFANGLDIKNCDFTVFSSIKCEGTTIKDIKNIGTSVSTRNQARLFLVFTTTFFPMAARNADQNESNTSLRFFIAFWYHALSLSLSLSVSRAKKGQPPRLFSKQNTPRSRLSLPSCALRLCLCFCFCFCARVKWVRKTLNAFFSRVFFFLSSSKTQKKYIYLNPKRPTRRLFWTKKGKKREEEKGHSTLSFVLFELC